MGIEVNTSQDDLDDESGHFAMQCERSNYNKDNHTIGVKLNLYIGYDEASNKVKEAPFYLDVSVEGAFEVDESAFPADKVEHWAETNAPLILYPYVREIAFSLTSRIMKEGAAVLPLLTVPTMKVVSKD